LDDLKRFEKPMKYVLEALTAELTLFLELPVEGG
jgi:hypothetical protein